MCSKNHRGAGGLFSGCGRYGYSANGSGMWINAKRIVQPEMSVEEKIFKHLLVLINERGRIRGIELIEKYIENEILPDELLVLAINSLPER